MLSSPPGFCTPEDTLTHGQSKTAPPSHPRGSRQPLCRPYVFICLKKNGVTNYSQSLHSQHTAPAHLIASQEIASLGTSVRTRPTRVSKVLEDHDVSALRAQDSASDTMLTRARASQHPRLRARAPTHHNTQDSHTFCLWLVDLSQHAIYTNATDICDAPDLIPLDPIRPQHCVPSHI